VEPLRFTAVPYDRARHEGFVRSSWTNGAHEPWESITKLVPAPGSNGATMVYKHVGLAELLRRPETQCLVAHLPGDPDSLLGWAAVTDGAVVWAYTRSLFGKVRRRGLATSLLYRMGIDVAEPTPCLYWSPAAAAIAARGYRIYYAPKGLKEAA